MCTLIVASRVWAGAPLVVAANRDERLDRASEPPQIRADGSIRLLAPRDAEAGGTWLGVNAAGVFCGITNRFNRPPDPSRRSRGGLVLAALGQPTATLAADRIAAIDPVAFNGFHLVAASAEDAHLVWNDGVAVARERLGPGVHVLTERSLGAAPSDREQRVVRRMRELAAGPMPAIETLQAVLRQHVGNPFESTCVHMDERGYGTRSSTIVLRAGDGAGWRVLHAEGPPCQNEHVEIDAAHTL